MCALLKRNILEYEIVDVDCVVDNLVFAFLKGADNEEEEIAKFRGSILHGRVSAVGRHGKYFWIRVVPRGSKESVVLLMHFGMTGMVKMRDVYSHLTIMENGGDKKVLPELKEDVKDEKVKVKRETIEVNKEKAQMEMETMEVKGDKVIDEPWPPKFVKLSMTLRKNDSTIEWVFVDPRRLARIRLLSGKGVQTDEELLKQPPLDVLGPDYSKPITVPKEIGPYGDPDPDNHGRAILSIDEFNKLVLTKKKPIKSLLLEQKFFCGIGNWVADEIIYHSRLHPEEVLSSKLTLQEEIDPVIQKLYDSIIYVCKEAVRVEGNVREFPDDWLMIFRWGKGRKGPRPKTKDGYDVDYITVGGRTSCFVPKLQAPLKRSSSAESSGKKRIKRE